MCVVERTTVTTQHDPVVMGGLSRRGDAPDKPGSLHEGNGYPHLAGGE